jgi:hypothetical protein
MADITVPFDVRVSFSYGPDLTPWQLKRAVRRAKVAMWASGGVDAWLDGSAPRRVAEAQVMWGEAAVLLLWVLLAEPLASDPEPR